MIFPRPCFGEGGWVGDGLLDTLSAGGVLQLGEHAAKPRLQAALFGRSELLGNGELGEAHQGLLDGL